MSPRWPVKALLCQDAGRAVGPGDGAIRPPENVSECPMEDPARVRGEHHQGFDFDQELKPLTGKEFERVYLR
jgi:hypothetical protein